MTTLKPITVKLCSSEATKLETANPPLTAELQQPGQIDGAMSVSETRYRHLYNHTPIALHSTNADARLIDVNDTWLALFEYTRHAVVGRSPADFMTPESAQRYRDRAWPDMLASGGALRVVDYQFVTRSGRVFDGRLSAAGSFDADGRFLRTSSAIADVTAELRAERMLRQAQRLESVGQLTAGIAHDFNNLLTAILGNLELLSKQPPREPAYTDRLIARAKSAAERGAKLTSQLLAFSRQQKIAAEPLDLNQVITGMLPLLRSTIGDSIGINLQPAPGLFAALGDSTQLELAILNLAINARDAMPNGGVITIATANVTLGEPAWPEEPAPGDYVAVRVSDTGFGIADVVRERMFEPFFTTKEIGKGSGLGLPQVLGVLKQLGGGLTVRTAPNEGTCISMFLPGAAPAPAGMGEPSAGCSAEAAPIVCRRILLVDDDADVRSITADMLENSGHQVVQASSGAAALDVLNRAESPVELVLADLAMPGINGVELAAIVRLTWPALPVLLMTGYADTSLTSPDADHEVLRKPFLAAELAASLQRAIVRHRSGPA